MKYKILPVLLFLFCFVFFSSFCQDRKKARIKKHGKGLSKVYLNALLKRKKKQPES